MTSILNYAIPCPKCKAAAGERCVNLDGSPASRSHVSRTPAAPCGSFGGYQRHRKAGEEPCDPCRDANRRYMQEYRSKNPDRHQADIDHLRRRREATRLLIQRHRDEFRALMSEVKLPS